MDIGVSKSSGISCYWGLSQKLTLTFFAREGGGSGVNPPEMIEQIVEMRTLEKSRTHSLERKFVLIVEGGRTYLEKWKATTIPVDLRIFVGVQTDLIALGIETIDTDWKQGDDALNLNDYLPQVDSI